MANLTDDPTTYLKRDTEDVCIMLAKSVTQAQEVARQYGVSIQVNMGGGLGIRAVTTLAEANAAIATYPANTPWCLARFDHDAITAEQALRGFFGAPITVAKALGVETDGIAWNPKTMPVR